MEIIATKNSRHWWVFLLRGIAFIGISIYMFSYPLSSFAALSFLFGLVVVFTGIAELLHAYANRHHKRWGWRFALGIFDVIIGIILMSHLAVSMTVLAFLIGIWFLFRGFSLLSFSGFVGHRWWIIIGGILTIIFALLIFINPAIGAITVVIWIAIAFLISGIFNCFLAFKLKD